MTVADDGGGSGMLRQDLGMPPPGDLRSCMEALANTEPLMRELMHYRFTEGSLAGQSFGNLFLAALNGISPSFDAAVARMSEVLAITGRVLPVTTADVQLKAFFENGASVVGESKIFYCKKREDCRITRVRLVPEHPRALPEALTAIRDADVLLLGPGSLYTSIIPQSAGGWDCAGNSGVSCTQDLRMQCHDPGGGDGRIYRLRPYPGAFSACGARPFAGMLANSSPIPREVAARYASEGAEPLQCDVRDLCCSRGGGGAPALWRW